tara:strand:+ start:10578 stop:12377 length:1800 start_codon:yes stop_codon:yes gene_type:complete
MAEKFLLTTTYKGYANKPEPTNLDPAFIVEGSQNVMINLDGSIGSRKGASTIATDITEVSEAITARMDWKTSRGDYFTLVRYGQNLDIIFLDTDKVLTTLNISTTIPVGSSAGSFDVVFDKTRVLDKMLFANGTHQLSTWSGAFTKVSAVTTDTMTVAASTWGAKGFAVSGTLRCEGVTYTYTGGGATGTLTGVTPDPTPTLNKYAFEAVLLETLTDVPTTYEIDYLGIYRNQNYLGSDTSREVLVSSGINYTLFTIPATRAAGDPNEFLLDDNSKGFMATKNSMLMFGSNDTVMEVRYVLSSDQTREAFTVDHVINGDNQGALSANGRVSVGGNIYYINRDKQMDIIEIGSTLTQSLDINPSELVQNDFDSFDWTDSQLTYWQRHIILVVPKQNTMLMFNLDQKLWQSPQIFTNIDLGSVSVSDDNRLIGHSYSKNVSYVLFDETTDNDLGVAIPTKAIFAYNNYGQRAANKDFSLYYQDGYITSGGELTRTVKYDYTGAEGVVSRTFKGIDTKFLQFNEENAGIGQAGIGERDLSGGSLEVASLDKRFRYANPFVRKDFYELQVSYEQKILGAAWRLVAHGPDVNINPDDINDIIQE